MWAQGRRDADRFRMAHSILDQARDKKWTQVKEALVEHPELINSQPAERFSVLHYAALANDYHMVDWLLARGANPMARTRERRNPASVSTSDKVQRMLQKAEDGAWLTVVSSYCASCGSRCGGSRPAAALRKADRPLGGVPAAAPQLSRALEIAHGRGGASRGGGPLRVNRTSDQAADLFKEYEGLLDFEGADDSMGRLMFGGFMDEFPRAPVAGHPRISRMLSSRQFLTGNER